MKFLTEAP